MPAVQTLTCANCGAALATTAPAGATLTCDYCGTPLVVPAAGGAPAPSAPPAAPPAGNAPVSDPSRPIPPAPEPPPYPERLVVPPERITIIPSGRRAGRWADPANRSRLSVWLALFVLVCCGLPLALALLCVATGLAGNFNLR